MSHKPCFHYDAFGAPKFDREHDPSLANRLQILHAGRRYDTDTRLYYNRARWYDPLTGRFLSEDPIGFSAGDANLYRYCGNSPTNATDPTGQFIVSVPVLLVAGISLLIGGASTAALYHAADQYDEASDILGIPTAELTQADIDRYGQLIDSARTWQAVGEVGGYTALAIAGAPLAAAASWAYVGGMTAAFGTFGTSAAVTSMATIAASGIYSVGAEGVAIAQDWNQMDNIERFHRVGLLAGPFVGGMGSGYLTRSWATVGLTRLRGPSNAVKTLGNEIKQFLGNESRMITNKAGDRIFISKGGLHRVRFDFNNPAPHTSPHAHVEVNVGGRWVKSGPLYPKDVPPH